MGHLPVGRQASGRIRKNKSGCAVGGALEVFAEALAGSERSGAKKFQPVVFPDCALRLVRKEAFRLT
jgi:hypothetical protein